MSDEFIAPQDELPSFSAAIAAEAEPSPPPPPPARSGLADDELSPQRLAMIHDYTQGRFRIPQLRDPAFMYKVVAAERDFQARQAVALSRRGETGSALNRAQGLVEVLADLLIDIASQRLM
jgi:hypothetical protein